MPDGTIGAIGGATTGAGIGTMIAPGIGTVIGAGIGGLAGWLAGREQAEEQARREAELRRLLAPTPYTPFLETEAGRQLAEALRSEIERQYRIAGAEARRRAGQWAAARGMLTTTALPIAMARAMTPVEQARAMGIARMGRILAEAEMAERARWQQQELARRLELARYLVRAGEISQEQYNQLVRGLMQLGGMGILGGFGFFR